ncbi:hypothetical protein JKP88DRAFT_256808 [Tribonema minus]|uniref:Transcription initiation factor IIE subunit beta n=1 Tax=Tribonema minus TaxID=303371 RepID=A0A836C8F9_9STRA|nr:hypothetical protein JKP88DRAFT_256808 [Tribonema minus]
MAMPQWLGGGHGTGVLGREDGLSGSSFLFGLGGGGGGGGGVRQKSAPEKQADVLEYLKDMPDRRPVSAADILVATGVDLEGADAEVKEMLSANPKVDIMEDGRYMYQAKYIASGRAALLSLIERCLSGVNRAELVDTYEGAARDMEDMIRGGEVIAIKHKEHGTVLLYPRGATFLTRLSGAVRIGPGERVATTSAPLAAELRRGEAVRIGDRWARVSCEVSTAPLDRQPARAAVPESVATDRDLSDRNVYAQPFGPEDLTLPLQTAPLPYAAAAAAGPGAPSGVYQGPAVRHGCSQRVRALWHETLQQVPKDDDAALHQMLFQAGLVTSAATGQQRRPKRFAQLTPEQRESQRSKQKRRIAVVKNAKLTNDHLDGTAIGILMEEARLNPEKYGL